MHPLLRLVPKASGSVFGGSEPGVSRDVKADGSCLVDTHCGDIYGSAFRAAKAPFPSQRAAPYAAGFQMSKSQERPPGAEHIANAVAQPPPDAEVQVGVRRRGKRVTAGPAEHDGRFFAKISS